MTKGMHKNFLTTSPFKYDVKTIFQFEGLEDVPAKMTQFFGISSQKYAVVRCRKDRENGAYMCSIIDFFVRDGIGGFPLMHYHVNSLILMYTTHFGKLDATLEDLHKELMSSKDTLLTPSELGVFMKAKKLNLLVFDTRRKTKSAQIVSSSEFSNWIFLLKDDGMYKLVAKKMEKDHLHFFFTTDDLIELFIQSDTSQIRGYNALGNIKPEMQVKIDLQEKLM